MVSFRVGDHITRPKGLVTHHALFLGSHHSADGRTWIIENAPGSGVTVALYDPRLPWTLAARPKRADVRQITARALSRLGASYNAVTFNCEHFVHYALHGRERSDQVLLWGLAAACTWLATRPFYDPALGRHRERNGRFARG